MKIGTLSQHTNVSIRMLRYYEEQGLLSPNRNSSGYRTYHSQDIQTIERIKLLSAAGMTLDTIRQFLPCIRGDALNFLPCDELKLLLHEQLQLTEHKISQLKQNQDLLQRFLQQIATAQIRPEAETKPQN